MKLLLSTFIVCLAYSICLLGAENQIEVGALLLVALGASIFAKKFGLMDRLGEAVNQIVFNATARHRTHHRAGFTQRHDGTDRTRRRTPGANHRGQQRTLVSLPPIAQGAQNHDVNVFHGAYFNAYAPLNS